MVKTMRNLAMLAAVAVGHSVTMAQVVVTYGPDVASVPTLSEWGMIIMAMALACVAVYAMRKNAGSKTIMSFALSATALFSASMGNQIIKSAQSLPPPSMNTPTGGTVNLLSNIGVRPVQNTTQVPLKIIGVTPGGAQSSPTTTCDPGVIVAPGSSCNVDTGDIT